MRFDAGEHIFRQGDEDRSVYVLQTGLLKAYYLSDEGKENIKSFIQPGELIGSLAAETSPYDPVAAPFSKYPDLRMMEDVFDVELPATRPKREVEFSIRPRFVDTVKEDYIRVPLRFKYGLTDKWEFAVRLQPYVNNPTQGDRENGVENIRFSTKYALDRPLFGEVDSAVGIGITLPLEDEKKGITDGYRHYTPFATFARWTMFSAVP